MLISCWVDLVGVKTCFRLNSIYQPTFSFDTNMTTSVKLGGIKKSVHGLHTNPASAVILRDISRTGHLYKDIAAFINLQQTEQKCSNKLENDVPLCAPIWSFCTLKTVLLSILILKEDIKLGRWSGLGMNSGLSKYSLLAWSIGIQIILTDGWTFEIWLQKLSKKFI